MEDAALPPSAATEQEQAEASEAGRLLFAHQCRFFWAASSLESLPEARAPEIAFAGRSNVGKSSLVNALVGMKALARTSITPGRTQQLNFFSLDDRLTLVDLPGYGYAQVSKTKVAEWTRLIENFLKGRQALRRTCVLVDARHGLKDSDRAAMSMLDAAAQPYQVVLTKGDALGVQARAAIREKVSAEIARRPAAHPLVALTSSRDGFGIPELRAELAALALPNKVALPQKERTP